MKSRFKQRGPARSSATECLPVTAYMAGWSICRANAPNDPRPALRSATSEDYCFAESLYVANMGPLFHELNAWDAEVAVKRLQASFAFAEVWMIKVDGQDVGWFQISEKSGQLELHQIHLVETARGRGIGTYILRCLMAKAQAEQKRISLAVLTNNRARHLYRKLGFAVVGADGVKLLMQWPDPGRAVRSKQRVCGQ
jgi:ribosomal protein S18 acetylase RimI-like enzyme